jgi:hypothetical protein
MSLLMFLIQLAAIVTPIFGIVVELRRDLPDDRDGGLMQTAGHRPAGQLVMADPAV